MSTIFYPQHLSAGGMFIRTDDGAVMSANFSYCDASAQGNTVLVPTQGAGVAIRILGLVVIADTTVVARLQQSVSGVTYNITAGNSVAQNGGWVMPFSPVGWCVSSPNGSINLNLNNSVVTGATCIWIPSVV